MDERDKGIMALDIIGNSRDVIAFIRDVASCPSIREELKPDGFEGLTRILDQVKDELLQASNLLQAR
ncbi:MAG: hypothetical protein PHI97_25620 [Desulfobulbus sp.]|nr:hypothetical protein [Desulfobulbus sp.]